MKRTVDNQRHVDGIVMELLNMIGAERDKEVTVVFREDTAFVAEEERPFIEPITGRAWTLEDAISIIHNTLRPDGRQYAYPNLIAWTPTTVIFTDFHDELMFSYFDHVPRHPEVQLKTESPT